VRAMFAGAMQAGGLDNFSIVVVSLREGEWRIAADKFHG